MKSHNRFVYTVHVPQTGDHFASYVSIQQHHSIHKRNSQQRHYFTYFNLFKTVNSKICPHLLLQNPYNIPHCKVCSHKKFCSTNVPLDGNSPPPPQHPHSLRISKWRNFPSLNIATGRGEEGWKGVEAYSLPLIRSNMVSNLT